MWVWVDSVALDVEVFFFFFGCNGFGCWLVAAMVGGCGGCGMGGCGGFFFFFFPLLLFVVMVDLVSGWWR